MVCNFFIAIFANIVYCPFFLDCSKWKLSFKKWYISHFNIFQYAYVFIFSLCFAFLGFLFPSFLAYGLNTQHFFIFHFIFWCDNENISCCEFSSEYIFGCTVYLAFAIQADLMDPAGLVPDHGSKAQYCILKQDKWIFWLLSTRKSYAFGKVMFIL